jgi:hypothetical protein
MAIHFHLPVHPLITLLCAADNPAVFAWAAHRFDCLLRHVSGHSDVDFGAQGDFENGLIVFRLPPLLGDEVEADRQWALERVFEFFHAEKNWIEVAWRHGAEGTWVYLHPEPAPSEPFARWLTDEQMDARDARTRTIQELIDEYRQPGDDQ